MNDLSCREAWLEWQSALDLEAAPPEWAARHVESCPHCAGRVQGAVRVRQEIAAWTLPPGDPAADLRVLSALRSERRSGWPAWLAGLERLTARPGLSLAAAGGASFVLTLLVAGLLSSGLPGSPRPGQGSEDVALESRTPARQVAAEIDARLEAWLESRTASPSTLLQARPAVPPRSRTKPAPPRQGRLPGREQRA